MNKTNRTLRIQISSSGNDEEHRRNRETPGEKEQIDARRFDREIRSGGQARSWRWIRGFGYAEGVIL